MKYKKLKSNDQKVPKQAKAKRDGVIKHFKSFDLQTCFVMITW